MLTSVQYVNVGPQVGEQWVLGGYDVVDKVHVGFMVPLDRRDVVMYRARNYNNLLHLWAA